MYNMQYINEELKNDREFALIAFGGSGPIHAASLAKEIGIPRVIIPNFPGVFSAYGLTKTDLTLEKNKIFYEDFDKIDPDIIFDSIENLKKELLDILTLLNIFLVIILREKGLKF